MQYLDKNLYFEFIDLGILSRYYFKEILEKMLFPKQYVLFYGDFRELGRMNLQIGMEQTDVAIQETLKAMIRILPEEAIKVRIAGDEYCFIVGWEKLKDTPDNYIRRCEEAFSNINVCNCHPFMDLVYEVGQQKTFLQQTFVNACMKMDMLKLQNRIILDHHFPDEKMIEMLEAAVFNIFNIFRIDQIDNHKIYQHTGLLVYQDCVEILDHLDEYSQNKIILETPNQDFQTGEYYYQIHEHFMNFEKNGIVTEDMLPVLKKLRRNSISGYYNKLLLEREYIDQHRGQKFHLLYFEVMGLKYVNELLGHEKVDKLLARMYEILNRELDLQNTNNYMPFDLLSARSVILFQNQKVLDYQKLKVCVDQINQTLFQDINIHLSYYLPTEQVDINHLLEMCDIYSSLLEGEKAETRFEILKSNSGKKAIALIIKNPLDCCLKAYSKRKTAELFEYAFMNQLIAQNPYLRSTKDIVIKSSALLPPIEK